MGGSHAHTASYTGGGNQYLCMSPSPEYLTTSPGMQGSAMLYRTEFELSDSPAYFFRTFFHDRDAACAVCQRPKSKSHALMIPGKMSCPVGYSTDYTGFLASTHSSYFKSEFTCLSGNLTEYGNPGSQDGSLMYLVETQTNVVGQLPRGYRENYEVTCTICSGMLIQRS